MIGPVVTTNLDSLVEEKRLCPAAVFRSLGSSPELAVSRPLPYQRYMDCMQVACSVMIKASRQPVSAFRLSPVAWVMRKPVDPESILYLLLLTQHLQAELQAPLLGFSMVRLCVSCACMGLSARKISRLAGERCHTYKDSTERRQCSGADFPTLAPAAPDVGRRRPSNPFFDRLKTGGWAGQYLPLAIRVATTFGMSSEHVRVEQVLQRQCSIYE